MIDTTHFKNLLEEELESLQSKLERLGHINPDNPGDWEPQSEDLNVLEMDPNEVADQIEEFEIDTATLKELEWRYNLVKLALTKIEKGTFGIDEVDGEEIPHERLEVNPAARTKIENVYKLDDPLI